MQDARNQQIGNLRLEGASYSVRSSTGPVAQGSLTSGLRPDTPTATECPVVATLSRRHPLLTPLATANVRFSEQK
jgi:hypothetical protein